MWTPSSASRSTGILVAALVALAVIVAAAVLPDGAIGEQAGSARHRVPAGFIDAGTAHSCVVLDDGAARCWGYGDRGVLGYGNSDYIGDDETPGSAGPVKLGSRRTAVAISAGRFHTCALLSDGTVPCWGYGGHGALGYGNTDNIGDDETPGSVGPVDLAGLVATRGSTGLSLRVKPGRDRTRPFEFTAQGRLRGLFAADEATCHGKIQVKAREDTVLAAHRGARLAPAAGACAYKTTLEPMQKGVFEITAGFAGNSNLEPATSPPVTVRAG